MPKLIVGNWKLNPATMNEAMALTAAVLTSVKSAMLENMVLLPPYIFLEELTKKFRNLQWGAQDVFWEQKGAYTGEVSLAMLKDIGVNWVLVGHSERRRYFGETDEVVNKKMLAALEQDFNVIVAVGELQRDDSEHEIIASFKASVSGFKLQDSGRLVVAYEPVWAIGTGEADDPERANKMINQLKSAAYKIFGPESSQIHFLYGGSVNSVNVSQFLVQPNINGVLVGGASVNTPEFSAIINISQNL